MAQIKYPNRYTKRKMEKKRKKKRAISPRVIVVQKDYKGIAGIAIIKEKEKYHVEFRKRGHKTIIMEATGKKNAFDVFNKNLHMIYPEHNGDDKK